MKHRLTYLSSTSLRNLERAARRAGAVPGDYLECGVALGGSAIVICTAMPPDRWFHGYDVFGTIPPPASPKDDAASKARYEVIASGQSAGIRGDLYYGYEPELERKVDSTLRAFGVSRYTLHRGLFDETLRVERPVAFAHLDCDWYDPMKLCLRRIYPLLSRGGLIVCDDYNSWGGARAAVDEFLDETPDLRFASWPDRDANVVLESAR